MSTWFDVDDEGGEPTVRLVAAWPDAPVANVETCGMLLEVARDQVWAFAPESEADDGESVDIPTDDIPNRLVYSQLQQAQNLWNAGRVSSDGNTGDGTYTFTPRPLDKTIRGIIRPIQGVPSVG
jgi:hypothetical protein